MYFMNMSTNIIPRMFHLFLLTLNSIKSINFSFELEFWKYCTHESASVLYFSAKCPALWRPSDLVTRSKAASTSPGLLNFLMIIVSNSGNWSLANRTGAVARPNFRSAPEGLPSSIRFSVINTSVINYNHHLYGTPCILLFTKILCTKLKIQHIINNLKGNSNV